MNGERYLPWGSLAAGWQRLSWLPLQAASAFSKVRQFLRDVDPAEGSEEAQPSSDVVISPTGKAAAVSGPSSRAAEKQAHLCKGDRAAVPSSHAAGVNEQRWRGATGAVAAAAQADSEHGTGAAGASCSGAAEDAAAAGGSRAGQDGAEQDGSDAEMLDAPAEGEGPEGASLERVPPLQQHSQGGAEGSKTLAPRQARSRQAPASQQVGAAPTRPSCTVPGSSLPACLGHSWCKAGQEHAPRWGIRWHVLG